MGKCLFSCAAVLCDRKKNRETYRHGASGPAVIENRNRDADSCLVSGRTRVATKDMNS